MSESSKDDHHHSSGESSCNCHSSVVNPSVVQSLDELEFERSIWQAAIDNNVQKILQFAKGSNFDVNSTDNYGYTALHYAARNGNLDAAKCLVKLGGNVNLPTGSLKATALHRAVTASKVEMVKYLLSVGSDPNIKDIDGFTALDRAIKVGPLRIDEKSVGHSQNYGRIQWNQRPITVQEILIPSKRHRK